MRVLDELILEKKELEELLQHPGWKRLEPIARGQFRAREMQLRNPIKSLDDAFAIANLQGDLSGLQLMFQFPNIRLNEINEELQMLKEEGRFDEGEDVNA